MGKAKRTELPTLAEYFGDGMRGHGFEEFQRATARWLDDEPRDECQAILAAFLRPMSIAIVEAGNQEAVRRASADNVLRLAPYAAGAAVSGAMISVLADGFPQDSLKTVLMAAFENGVDMMLAAQGGRDEG
ncbi:hypothetical protein L0F51_04020 [Afifella sp. H1R]|uniref:hypothetical protein n=1 Tax=Afifella sp. H1R TaxID=2908841 RepID=UPI001F441C1B|nr:hypothetical protein [Afifella sp. H1R]MCF1502932.1 hypothetical protein [Afifella sp. H1R]